MDLAITRALSAVAANMAWVNCLSICLFSESPVIPLAAASSPGIGVVSKQSAINTY
jgi:hypothetical protein